MGLAQAKLKRAIAENNAPKCIEIYTNLNKKSDFNANTIINKKEKLTVLHFTAQCAQKELFQVLLDDAETDVNLETAHRQTCVHLLCSSGTKSVKRVECFGVLMKSIHRSNIGLKHVDSFGETCLHISARNGLARIVDQLISADVPLTLENNYGKTAADEAEARFPALAEKLESMVVLGSIDTDLDGKRLDTITESDMGDDDDRPMLGLNEQELIRERDGIIIEASTALGVSLLDSERLLRETEWNSADLIESFVNQPEIVLSKIQENTSAVKVSIDDTTCGICFDTFSKEELVFIGCGHPFCKECWKQYLETKIVAAKVADLKCPIPDCNAFIRKVDVENLISKDMVERFLRFDLQAFVDANPKLKWCTHPGCDRAVKRNDKSITTVDCGHSPDIHMFCWECGQSPHAPCTCEEFHDWKVTIAEFDKKKGEDGNGGENVASGLWVLANTKACPKCHCPIEKNDGCNHMTCSKCSWEFCWLCTQPWKQHGTSTGGYYRCTMFEEKEKEYTEVHEKQLKEANEMARIFHYLVRFREHLRSLDMEQKTLQDTLIRLKNSMHSKSHHVEFLNAAKKQLFIARYMVANTYALCYLLGSDSPHKHDIEKALGECQSHTEWLSEMLTRNRLRCSKEAVVTMTTQLNRSCGYLARMTSGCRKIISKKKRKKDRKRNSHRDSVPQLQPSPPAASMEAVLSAVRILCASISDDLKKRTSMTSGRNRSRSSKQSSQASEDNDESIDAGDIKMEFIPEGEENIETVFSESSMDDGWTCSLCTFDNPSSAKDCQICSSAGPIDTKAIKEKRRASKRQREEKTIHNKLRVAAWECSICTLVNSADNTICMACETPRGSVINEDGIVVIKESSSSGSSSRTDSSSSGNVSNKSSSSSNHSDRRRLGSNTNNSNNNNKNNNNTVRRNKREIRRSEGTRLSKSEKRSSRRSSKHRHHHLETVKSVKSDGDNQSSNNDIDSSEVFQNDLMRSWLCDKCLTLNPLGIETCVICGEKK